MRIATLMIVGCSLFAASLAPASEVDRAFDELPGEKIEQLGEKPNIEHSFTIKGKGENDKTEYTGSATISKIGGDMYNGSWKIGSNTFKGICFRDDDMLSCAWAVKTSGLGVVAYLVQKDGLDGVWFQTGGTKLGKEFLKPSGGKMRKDADGGYSISKGENPDGTKYGGTAAVKLLDNGVYKFDWKIGGSDIKGIGIRLVEGEDDVIATAFDTGGDYGVLQYDIAEDGKSMKGVWAQSIGGKLSKGTESLVRK